MAALLCLLGPLTVPFGPVPLSLVSFGIYLAAQVLGAKNGAAAVLIYILTGMAGLPVFSGFTGGAAPLIGPTGGFIIGYIPCALLAGRGNLESELKMGFNMATGTVVLYAIGTIWFMLQSGTGAIPALITCVLPFVPGDSLKIIAVCILGKKLRRIQKIL